MPVPDLNRVPEFYHNYIRLAGSADLVTTLNEQGLSFRQFMDSIPENKIDHRYADGKWSIKELVQHCIDAERIFAYRALCIARRDQTAFPGFDEEAYAKNAKTEKRNWNDLKEEFSVVRKSSVMLFDSFDEDQLETAGTVNGHSNYVRAFGYISIGHLKHHERIIRERYL